MVEQKDLKVLLVGAVCMRYPHKRLTRLIDMTKKQLFEAVLALESPVNKAFEAQLKLIKDPNKRSIVENILRTINTRNVDEAASSSGKYHPEYSQGKGGLSRHTKAVVSFTADACEAFPELDYDTMIIAGLCHDLAKYKNEGKYTSRTHAADMADRLQKEGLEAEAKLVRSHMGKFDKDAPTPSTFEEKILHFCDYLASRQYYSVMFDENDNIIKSNIGYTHIKKDEKENLERKSDELDMFLGKKDIPF